MKKILIALQIILVIGIVAYIIFTLLQPVPKLDYHPETWNSWQGFYVLSYAGVTKKEDTIYVSQKILKEQLSALKNSGYKTVTPDDVMAFLESRAPLPDKALLLLFEGGRKDSFLYATPLLRRLGMTATMCVPTGHMDTWNGFYLKKGDLKKIFKQSHWNPCSMGDNAITEIPADNSGRKGHFLTTRKWLGENYENDAVFQIRVSEDYAKAARFLEEVSGGRVSTYMYPFADTGTGPEADPLAEQINQKAVATYHKIAFSSADNPFNGLYSKPFRLSRLRVYNTWDGPELIDMLNKFVPREAPVYGLDDLSIWFIRGDVRQERGVLIFSPNSGIWLRGSDNWADLDVTTLVNLPEGASVALYVRSDGTDSFVRLTLNQNKAVLLERHKTTTQTLIRESVSSKSRGEHKLRLRMKGNRAWIWHNDKSIATSVPISPYIVRGRVGIVSIGSEIQLVDFKAVPIPKLYAFADRYHTLPHSTKQEISVILPGWFSSDDPPVLNEKQRIDLLMTASSGVQTIPIIKIQKEMTAEDAEMFVKALASVLDHPTVKPFITHLAVYGLENELPNALHMYGYKLVRILSPEEARRFVEQKQKLDSDILLIDGQEEETRETLKILLHIIPCDRLIARVDTPSGLPAGVSAAEIWPNTTVKGTQ